MEWRLGGGSADSSATNDQEIHQPWNRPAPLMSSESDSDAEETWAELQELRER